MIQIHLCMQHGYKNSKFQISTRGPCKKKCRKSRESKEAFIRRLYFSEDTKRRLECIYWTLSINRYSCWFFFFNVLRMKKSEFKWNNLLQVKIKQFWENTLTVCACSESYHEAQNAVSVITSKPVLAVGSRMLINPGCPGLASLHKECQKTYLKS